METLNLFLGDSIILWYVTSFDSNLSAYSKPFLSSSSETQQPTSDDRVRTWSALLSSAQHSQSQVADKALFDGSTVRRFDRQLKIASFTPVGDYCAFSFGCLTIISGGDPVKREDEEANLKRYRLSQAAHSDS
jgi:hypothetical protein